MIPSIDTRLASMASALSGVIRPALDAEQMFAAEQAALLLAHIQLLRAQEPIAQEFEQLDYNRTRAFAHALLASAGHDGGGRTRTCTDELSALLRMPVPFTAASLRDAQDMLARGIGRLIEAVGQDGSNAAILATQETTLEYERAQSLRFRSYFSMMGYEDGSRDIASPDTMMAEFRQAYGAPSPSESR